MNKIQREHIERIKEDIRASLNCALSIYESEKNSPDLAKKMANTAVEHLSKITENNSHLIYTSGGKSLAFRRRL